jgi:hypothetical protein
LRQKADYRPRPFRENVDEDPAIAALTAARSASPYWLISEPPFGVRIMAQRSLQMLVTNAKTGERRETPDRILWIF